MATSFLDQYDALDVIGNGSFGIIRKVRRKADGSIFARKELNFERMSERDRKQIVAEVNILKDLHHEHIVRYHDRYVDRDAGILYILMEYCGGGDLSTVIKQAQRHGRPIPEDTIWNYFMQILLALQHCHHPNGHGRNGSSGTGGFDSDSTQTQRRAQILHRDIKPDNIFLDEHNIVKLGDFGLSKALPHTTFANTYVGTPYYMSPELMQEKAYDSKSDMWSLGCLIYELCALKPPFHEAKTHAELSILIRNGRIPPLPKGYSQSLGAVIKSMLNLNPAMRPSAAQLLQHERLDLVQKISEADKMFSTVKSHKANLMARERDIVSREKVLIEREQQLSMVVSQKDAEIASMQQAIAQAQEYQQRAEAGVVTAVREAISKREQELRVLVLKREEEVAAAMAKREEEIIASVNKREQELNDAWASREEEIRREVEERTRWVEERANWVEERAKWMETREAELAEVEGWLDGVRIELEEEEKRLEEVRSTVEDNMKKWEETAKTRTTFKGRAGKTPLEEVKNLLEPLSRLGPNNAENDATSVTVISKPSRKNNLKPRSPSPFPGLATPAPPPSRTRLPPPASAMKGVVLTSTGEILSTPAPGPIPFTPSPPGGATITPTGLPSVELTKLFVESPKVGLDFGKIFDSRTDGSDGSGDADDRTETLSKGWEGVRTINPDTENEDDDDDDDDESPPPSPSWRKEKELNRTGSHSWGRETGSRRRDKGRESENENQKSSGSSNGSISKKQGGALTTPATRLRRPSIRRRCSGALLGSVSDPMNLNNKGSSSQKAVPLPLPHPHLHSHSNNNSETSTGSSTARVMQRTMSAPSQTAEYDPNDENLPSPFLKRTEKERSQSTNSLGFHGNNPTGTVAGRKRLSNGNNLLRAVAAVNNITAHERGVSSPGNATPSGVSRPSILSARKASEEAKRALSR
ncbi:kinase-like protein [Marasmius fiardii PR-910]|nr:kinase-like protein [Marasmius fiardii PR-910]